MVPNSRGRSGRTLPNPHPHRFVHERRWILDARPGTCALAPGRGKPVGVLDRIRRLVETEIAFVESTADVDAMTIESRCDDGRHERVRLRIACRERR
jgi:hypothetical protein